MFGGLEVKSATPDRKKSNSAASTNAAEGPAAAVPSASSSFSFLQPSNSTSNPDPSPGNAGFSFLSGAPSHDSADAAPETTTTSAFGFMSSGNANQTTVNESEPATSTENHESTASTGFSFLRSSEIVREESEVATTTTATGSGFGFLATHQSDNQTVSTISRDSPAPIDEPEDLLGVGSSDSAPMGTGIVFGGAASIPKAVKKKRNRTAKIGTATSGTVPSTVPEIPSSNNSTMSNEIPPRPPVTERQAAAQATQRAEEFLHQKITEQTQQPTKQVTPEPQETPQPEVTLSLDSEDDDIIAAAKAAAQEAKSLNKTTKGWGLFRARASPPPPPSKSITKIQTQRSDGSQKSASERLQREQEEHKRAMAARHLELMRDQEVTAEIEPPKFSFTSSAPSIMAKEPFAPPAAVVTTNTPRKDIKTPTDKFHDMIDEFSQQVLRSMDEVTRLRKHRSALLEERFATIARERLAAQQKEAAEAQQAAAAEAEDFELADRLGSAINEHERERLQYSSTLQNISRALAQLEAQKQQTVDAVTKCFLKVQSKLKDFQKEQELHETEDTTDKMKKFEAVAKHLSAEHERLEQDHKHLHRDSEQVAQERQDVEDAISEQAGQYEKLRDEARENLKTVEEEIEELRRRLVAKQALAAKLRTEAAGHDEAVLKVRVKFSRQLNRVQTKEISLQDHREEWESEKRQYDTQKAEHDAEVQAHAEAMLARDKLLSSLKTEIDMADTFGEIVAKEIGFDLSTDGDAEGHNEASQIQAEVVKTEAALSEAKALLQSASLRLSGLENEKEDLERCIPLLEDAKKDAAARKDFKAASKASKDQKEAETRLKDCIDELEGEAREKTETFTLEVQRLESELEEKRAEALEQERESSLVTMQRLADNIKRLIATKMSVCGECDPKSVRSVGAYVLDCQIDALRTEGETFGEKYGGWTELVSGIDLETVQRSPQKEKTPSTLVEEGARTDAELPLKYHELTEQNENPTDEICDETSAILKDQKKRRYRELFARLKEIEDLVTAAAEEEDFERAAELQEELEALLAEVESIDLTDAEMEAALVEDTRDSSPEETDVTPAVEHVDSVTSYVHDESHVQDECQLTPDDNALAIEDEEYVADTSPKNKSHDSLEESGPSEHVSEEDEDNDEDENSAGNKSISGSPADSIDGSEVVEKTALSYDENHNSSPEAGEDDDNDDL